MEDLRNIVLDIVKREGPLLPIVISRKLKRDTFYASAILSELISRKDVMITKGKIGGSPLYYAKGQEHRLQMLYSHLGEKPQKAFSLLKEKRILRDKECEPWQRVALREIEDFAKPLEVKTNEESELFWKWYLISNEEAEKILEGIFKKPEQIVKEEKPIEQKIIEEKPQEVQELKKEPEKKKITRKKTPDIDLTLKADEFFKKNNIEILQSLVKEKNEAEYIVNVPSQIGNLKYLAKINKKKKLNEGDLSLAIDKGREKNLPVLFLISGEITKKAQNYLDKELGGKLVVRRLS
nr:hypothetical protein [Candidatus Woesearchaeota archaeon]